MERKNCILVVDDDPYNLAAMSDLLEEYGYSVVTCSAASQALDALKAKPVDVILTDVRMPDISGIELLETVCGMRPELPVILMTAHDDHDIAVDAIRKGAFDLIVKPFKPLQLFHSVEKAIHFLTLKEDLSLRVRTEEKLREIQAELVRAYAELKATHDQLLQSEKLASVGQLAAGVAHEINNPTGFIASNLNTLQKYLGRLTEFIRIQSEAYEGLPDKNLAEAIRQKRRTLKIDHILADGEELIKESLEGTERVRTIVQNLKNFSRMDDAESGCVDINEGIISTINIVWNELKYKASLIKELGDIPLTRCYPQQINQVFMNLLVNAAQAIEKQGEITVRTWHENGFIHATVSDTGCGMPPAVRKRIFEPFFTTKESGKGTGLGLSISYDIIKKYNGEITVDSEEGKGTTFTVILPVTE